MSESSNFGGALHCVLPELMGSTLRKWLARAFASVLFIWSVWYVASRFQWAQIGTLLREVNLTLLIGGCGLVIVLYFLVRSLRWWVMVRNLGVCVPFRDLYFITAVSLGFSLVTPGQLGEALKVELLKRRGLIGRVPGLGSFLIERIMDIIVLSALGVLCLLTEVRLLPGQEILRTLVIGFLIAGFAALAMVLLIRPKGRLGETLDRLTAASKDIKTLFQVGLLSILSWLLVALGWHLSLLSVGISLGLLQTIWLMCVVAVAQIASFIPGGLGISEVVTIKLLANAGVSDIGAQLAAAILRIYGLLVIACAGFHVPFVVFGKTGASR